MVKEAIKNIDVKQLCEEKAVLNLGLVIDKDVKKTNEEILYRKPLSNKEEIIEEKKLSNDALKIRIIKNRNNEVVHSNIEDNKKDDIKSSPKPKDSRSKREEQEEIFVEENE